MCSTEMEVCLIWTKKEEAGNENGNKKGKERIR